MTTFQRRVIQKIRHEIVIEGPATQVDLSKMLNMARQEAGPDTASYDDGIMLRTEDESIVLYWDADVPDHGVASAAKDVVQIRMLPGTKEVVADFLEVNYGAELLAEGRVDGIPTFGIRSNNIIERQG